MTADDAARAAEMVRAGTPSLAVARAFDMGVRRLTLGLAEHGLSLRSLRFEAQAAGPVRRSPSVMLRPDEYRAVLTYAAAHDISASEAVRRGLRRLGVLPDEPQEP